MKKYTDYQRYINVINRAVEEFGLEPDFEESLNEIYFQASELIVNGIDGCEKVIVGQLGNHNRHLYWNDDMGKEKEVDGEIINCDKQHDRWMRWNTEQKNYIKIENWLEVDMENDYVLCDTDLDSEGNVVCIIARPL